MPVKVASTAIKDAKEHAKAEAAERSAKWKAEAATRAAQKKAEEARKKREETGQVSMFDMSYVEVVGYLGSNTSLADATSPLVFLADRNGVAFIGFLTSVCAMISFWSGFVACITAAARVMMSMGKDKTIPAVFAKCHKIHGTPYVSLAACTIIAALPVFILHFAKVSIMEIFNYVGTIATLGFLVSYLLIAVSAPIFLYRRRELRWYHVLLAIITSFLLCIPLVGSIYPWPAWPMGILPILYPLACVLRSMVFTCIQTS